MKCWRSLQLFRCSYRQTWNCTHCAACQPCLRVTWQTLRCQFLRAWLCKNCAANLWHVTLQALRCKPLPATLQTLRGTSLLTWLCNCTLRGMRSHCDGRSSTWRSHHQQLIRHLLSVKIYNLALASTDAERRPPVPWDSPQTRRQGTPTQKCHRKSLFAMAGFVVHVDILRDEDLKDLTLSPATFHGS